MLSALISLTDYDVADLIKIGTYAEASPLDMMYCFVTDFGLIPFFSSSIVCLLVRKLTPISASLAHRFPTLYPHIYIDLVRN